MDIGWDQLATVAQLITGAATLGVAVLLVSQLRQQQLGARNSVYVSRADARPYVHGSDFRFWAHLG